MANYQVLKNAVQQVIKPNGNEEITGQIMQQALIAMINALGKGYQFIGVVSPDTEFTPSDEKIVAVGFTAGIYRYFGGVELESGKFAIFTYDGEWSVSLQDYVTQAQLSLKQNALSSQQLQNIADVPNKANDSDVIKHTAQTLTQIQKTQARENIGITDEMISYIMNDGTNYKWLDADGKLRVSTTKPAEDDAIIIYAVPSMSGSQGEKFRGYSLLEKIFASNWDASAVTSMYSMFSQCSSLESLDLSNWDVSAVTTMNSTFLNCSSLVSLDLSNWDVSAVTSMYSMFSQCSSLESLDLSNWDASAVTNMASMFLNCSSLVSLDLSNWDVSAVTSIDSIFSQCSSLVSLDLSSWDVSAVTSMYAMFSKCSSLESLVGDKTYEEVIADDIKALNGASVDYSLSFSLLLNRASARALINGLATLPSGTSHTLTLHANTKALLSDDDIAVATLKGWTIA